MMEDYRYCTMDWELVDVEDLVCPVHGVSTVPIRNEEYFRKNYED